MAQNRRSFLSMAALSAGAVTFSSPLYGKSVQKTHSESDIPSIIEGVMEKVSIVEPTALNVVENADNEANISCISCRQS